MERIEIATQLLAGILANNELTTYVNYNNPIHIKEMVELATEYADTLFETDALNPFNPC
jgi:hypothetical protein